MSKSRQAPQRSAREHQESPDRVRLLAQISNSSGIDTVPYLAIQHARNAQCGARTGVRLRLGVALGLTLTRLRHGLTDTVANVDRRRA
jgi:hypothetical protein